jgi:hypothetical protein
LQYVDNDNNPKTSKPKKQKNKTLKKPFWFSLKRCFFCFPCCCFFFFCFFGFELQKPKKPCVFLVCENFEIWVLKPKKQKKHKEHQKKQSSEAKPKSLFKVVFCFFIGMFFGYIFVFLFGFLYYCTFLMWCCAESIVDAFCVWVVFLVFMVNPLS